MTVELRPAYEWTCPDCGRDQFEYAIVAELSPEDIDELRSEHGIQPWETGNFQQMPKSVRCHSCGSEHDTTPLDVEH